MHLVVVFGPPAVGKMTVGKEICARTGYKLFTNHMTIEPFLGIFGFGTPSFNRLSSELRVRVVEEAIASGLPGLVFTLVWGLELEDDRDFVQGFADMVHRAGGRVSFVELAATLEERVVRNNTELRLAEKPSKRDRQFNDANLLSLERYVMNTGEVATPADRLLATQEHVRIDNTDLSPADAAERAVAALGL